jgi:signal recognition particle subunit SRP54
MGPLDDILKMIPGMSKVAAQGISVDPKQLGRTEAIICSMTPAERTRPTQLDGSRR